MGIVACSLQDIFFLSVYFVMCPYVMSYFAYFVIKKLKGGGQNS